MAECPQQAGYCAQLKISFSHQLLRFIFNPQIILEESGRVLPWRNEVSIEFIHIHGVMHLPQLLMHDLSSLLIEHFKKMTKMTSF